MFKEPFPKPVTPILVKDERSERMLKAFSSEALKKNWDNTFIGFCYSMEYFSRQSCPFYL